MKLKSGDLIWTVVATGAAAGAAGATGAAAGADDKTPLVMVHGLGGGTGLWVSLNHHFSTQTLSFFEFKSTSVESNHRRRPLKCLSSTTSSSLTFVHL